MRNEEAIRSGRNDSHRPKEYPTPV